MPRPKLPNQILLADRIKNLRSASRISNSELARRTGWSQSKASRVERGVTLLGYEDVEPLAAALQLDAEVVAELRKLVHAAHLEFQDWMSLYYASGGGAKVQQAISSIEHATTVTREFWPNMLPGLLQTEAYARDAVCIPGGPRAWGADLDECEKIVAGRMARQAVLREPGRKWHFVLGEAALWTRFGSAETLGAQLGHLVALMTERDAVDLRVLPLAAKLPAFPMATFSIYDEHLVSLEEQGGEHTIADPAQVKRYIDQFDLLAAAALKRRSSIALIRQVADRIR